MASTSDPLWLVPVILLGFPFAFAGVWSFVCGLLAVVSGYRSLLQHRIDRAAADEGEKLPTPWFSTIGWVPYRGILSFRAGPAGLTLRVLRIFPFHPPIRVPWERIQEAGSSMLLDGRVRLGVPPAVFAAIRDAKARHAA